MSFIICGVLPYITILVFVLGLASRFYLWSKSPQPGAVTLFPAPQGGASTFLSVVREAFLFPGLFRGDKMLWVFAWIFHVALALIIIGHIRVFTDFPGLWAALGINADKMSAVAGGAAGIVVTVFAFLLIIRRMIIMRVKEISTFADFFALLLIIAVLLTGNAMRFGEHFDLKITRAYFAHLLTFSASSSTIPASGMFILHFFLVQALIVIIPFSKILHFGGIFFTQAVIQKS